MIRPPREAWWIGSSHPFDLHEAYLNFRRDVKLDRLPRKAVLTITADSRYRLWINGHYVARGPARCWPQAQSCDELDVARYLRAGLNRIAIQVYSPGYSHFSYVHRGACGMLAWLTCDGKVIAKTDAGWNVRRDLSWRSDVSRVSIYGSGVERRNLADAGDWPKADAAAWPQARIVAAPEGAVWASLKARDIPTLAETVKPLRSPFILRGGVVENLSDDPHAALRQAFAATRIRRAPAEGDTCRIWVFDLGHSQMCTGMADISNAQGGERLFISYAEKLRGGELILSDPSTYCRMRPTDEFILRAGDQHAEGFSQRGARYLIFVLWSARPSPAQLRFNVRSTVYPLAMRTGHSATGSLRKIEHMCQQTTLTCLQDGFVDSIWRESSQWLGDGVAQSFALAALSKDYRPIRRAIIMAAEGAYPYGLLPSVLPGEVHAYTVTDYNFAWIELVHFYCFVLKPKEAKRVLAFAQPVMERLLARFAKHELSSSLLTSEAGWRLFLDWSPMDRREPNLTYNARYLHALQLAALMASSPSVRQRFQRKAKRLSKVMTATFSNGVDWQESPGGAPASQLGLSFLILTGVLRGAAAKAAAGRITARSLDPAPQTAEGLLVLASPFMHHYVFQALHKLGRGDDILKIIKARWGPWAEAGEPTTWENWSIDFPDGSACHGFSAHPLGWIRKLQGKGGGVP